MLGLQNKKKNTRKSPTISRLPLPNFPLFACAHVIKAFAPVPTTSGTKKTQFQPILQPNFQPDYRKLWTTGGSPKSQLLARHPNTTIDGNLLINISLAINKQIFPQLQVAPICEGSNGNWERYRDCHINANAACLPKECVCALRQFFI